MKLHGCNVLVKEDPQFEGRWVVQIGEYDDKITTKEKAWNIREEIIKNQEIIERLKKCNEDLLSSPLEICPDKWMDCNINNYIDNETIITKERGKQDV